MQGFGVHYRNYGHWDIYQGDGRAFRIRGGPGKYFAIDERAKPSVLTEFKTIGACMSFITDELMFELIIAEGQEPQVIESWNV